MSDLKATYLITAQQGMDFTRASAVRYLRAIADRLNEDACKKHEIDPRALLRDAALLRATAIDLEQRLDLDPERLRELGVTT